MVGAEGPRSDAAQPGRVDRVQRLRILSIISTRNDGMSIAGREGPCRPGAGSTKIACGRSSVCATYFHMSAGRSKNVVAMVWGAGWVGGWVWKGVGLSGAGGKRDAGVGSFVFFYCQTQKTRWGTRPETHRKKGVVGPLIFFAFVLHLSLKKKRGGRGWAG